MASEKKKKASKSAGGRTTHEKFNMLEVHRSELKAAPYNPRTLSEKARDHLKKNMQKVGMIQPPIWNKRTGNLVGGHQRLMILDAMEGTPDYRLTVAVVDFDEKTEKEQNIFLNNPNAMGDWDLGKLKTMFKDGEVDALLAGFDMAEIYQLFGEDVMAGQDDAAQALAGSYDSFNKQFDSLASRAQQRDGEAFYSLLIFRDNEEREAFCKLLGVADNRYLDGRRVRELIEAKAKPTESATG